MKKPVISSKIPRLQFAKLPTPVTNVSIQSDEEPYSFSIKRDDLSHPEYGGNKVRKLEYVIADVLEKGKKEIVTFGAIGTNHGVATALFCKNHNIKCTIILFDQPRTQTVVSNLKLMASLGATLVYKKSLFAAALHFYRMRLFQSPSQYFLFAGGSNEAGCFGFINAAFELQNQINRHELKQPDYIYCPVGSSATLAGLSLGTQLCGLDTRVIGVRVAPSHLGVIPACTPGTIKTLINKTIKQLVRLKEIPDNFHPREISLIDDYYGKAYGEATHESIKAAQLLANEGITLENTYTAKTVAALLDHIKREPDKEFLYWHTFNSADIRPLISPSWKQHVPNSLVNTLEK